MSTFDVNSFASMTITESNSTRMAPVPEGEYNAVILGPFNDQGKSGLRTTSKGSLILDVQWQIDDAAAAEATGVKNPTVRQSVFLDTTPAGGLDMGPGKNTGLGRLREALGQNQKGTPWTMNNIIGSVARIRVSHRIVRDEATGEENIYADVKGVTKA